MFNISNSESETTYQETNYIPINYFIEENIKLLMKNNFSFGHAERKEENSDSENSNERIKNIFPLDSNSCLNLDEDEDELEDSTIFKKRTIKKLFKVIYPEQKYLFTYAVKKLKDKYTNINKHKNKAYSKKRARRKTNRDNIRKVIKSRFFAALIKSLNKLVQKEGYQFIFKKLNHNFVSNVSTAREKINIEKTLFEILEEFSKKNNSELSDRIKMRENPKINRILNRKYCELFEEYLNSEDFNDEIKRLEKLKDSVNSKKIISHEYIEKYIYLSESFIEYYAKRN